MTYVLKSIHFLAYFNFFLNNDNLIASYRLMHKCIPFSLVWSIPSHAAHAAPASPSAAAPPVDPGPSG